MTTDYSEMKWSVRVSTRERTGATVYARKNRFNVGGALALDAEADRPSALEFLLGAVGADLVVGMKEACHRKRLEVDSVEAVVGGTLNNPLTHLGVVGEEGDPGLAGLSIKVFVETLEEDDDVRKVWEQVLARSPMYRTFSPFVRFDLRLQVVM